jgi:lectin, mannose-binding 1
MDSPPDPSQHTSERDYSSERKTRNVEQSADAPAADFKSTEDQFKDLHDRLQVIHHQLNSLVHDFEGVKIHASDQQDIMIRRHLEPMHDFQDELRAKLVNIEEDVEIMRKEIDSKDFKEAIHSLHDAFRDSHASILHHLPDRK